MSPKTPPEFTHDRLKNWAWSLLEEGNSLGDHLLDYANAWEAEVRTLAAAEVAKLQATLVAQSKAHHAEVQEQVDAAREACRLAAEFMCVGEISKDGDAEFGFSLEPGEKLYVVRAAPLQREQGEETRRAAEALIEAIDDTERFRPCRESELVPRAELAKLRAALAGVGPNEGSVNQAWLPISSAPKDGTQILLCDDDGIRVVGQWGKHNHIPMYGWIRPVELYGEEVDGFDAVCWIPINAAPTGATRGSGVINAPSK